MDSSADGRNGAPTPDDVRRYEAMLEELRRLGSAVVAFSGGVDSAFLLHAAKEALGDRVLAITAVFLCGLLLDLVGFLFSTFIMMFILFGVFSTGNRNWGWVFVCAAVTALMGWILFDVVLNVPFPRARWMALWR